MVSEDEEKANDEEDELKVRAAKGERPSPPFSGQRP